MTPAINPAWPDSAAVREQESLAPHTTFAIGGPADFFAVAASTAELVALLEVATADGLPTTILGEGSNSLIGDAGVRGLVIHNRNSRIESVAPARLRAGSGLLMGRLAAWSAEHGLAGLEFGVGIPGTLGASVFGNAGCFGAEIKDVLIEADIWNQGARRTFTNTELDFAYRTSALQSLPGAPVVLEAVLLGTPDDPGSINNRMTELSRQRRDTQPAEPSAGSIFRNPPGDHAGRLIDAAGLKGARSGAAQISERHANFIINRGGATAADVMNLIERARAAVASEFDVQLQTEIRLIGEGFGAAS